MIAMLFDRHGKLVASFNAPNDVSLIKYDGAFFVRQKPENPIFIATGVYKKHKLKETSK